MQIIKKQPTIGLILNEMKTTFLITLLSLLSVFSVTAGNQNIANLISSSDWNTIFPNRAQAGHPQGATDDFYSYAKFSSAVDKISEYSVTFSSGPGGQGTSVAVKKTDGTSYTYVITSSSWAGDDYTVDYSTFCNSGSVHNDKRELAAFLANITKETTGGWVDPDPTAGANAQPSGSHGSWGLYFLRQLGSSGPTSVPSDCYTSGSTIDYQPASGKCYYGRGPIQISYFYNYGNFSDFYFNNNTLVNTPELLEQDGELALLSAIWFWMTPQCPKPSCHQVMQEVYDESATTYSSAKMSKKGFLHTVNIINGAVECRSSGVTQPVLRSKLYKYYMSLVGFTSTEIDNEDMGEYSTLCNQGGTMSNYTSCDFQNVVVNNCSAPALGVDVELSGGSASLNANVTLKSGESIAWYKDDVRINGETSTTYTATEVGTYKAVVTGDDCTKDDAIIVSAEVFLCSEPSFPRYTELVSGSVTLDANITLADGETIAWYKDDVLIDDATSTTYIATAAGTYKAVTTRPGCTGEDAIDVYNEGEGPTCSVPAFEDTLELVGGSAFLDTKIDALQDGETIKWYKDGAEISFQTGTSYSATAVGTYKVVITGDDCTEEDEVEVAVICSKPNLGSNKSFTGDPVILDANITLKPGETLAWFKDGIQQWGTSGTTFTANALGTYKAVVTGTQNWATVCTAEDEVEVAETVCSEPALGEDLKLCQGTTITLDANVVLETGESLKWYKDNAEISEADATNYTVESIGTYKAEVTATDGCTRSDEIVIADGGAQRLVIDASNDGKFCPTGDPSELTLTVTGGEGVYDFYDVATEGEALGSGASFLVNSSLVNIGETKTFYVQEPSGPPISLGGSESLNHSNWANFSTNSGWNNYRVVVNALEKVNLESVDIVLDDMWPVPVSPAIVVTVYELGTDNVVETKTVELNGDDISYVAGSTHPLNKVQLDLEIPKGNYEISFIGSTFLFNSSLSGVDFSDPKFYSEGVVEIKGVNQPNSWGYPEVNGMHLGIYNWVFRSGATNACGRASLEVSADCGNSINVKEVVVDGIAVYPNPASDVVNVNLGRINAANSFIELYSAVGQLVMSKNINSVSGNVTQFETVDLDGGLYFIKVLAEGKIYTTSVVITK